MRGYEVIKIEELKIAIPNISANRARALEKHLNKMVVEMSVTLLQLALLPEIESGETISPIIHREPSGSV